MIKASPKFMYPSVNEKGCFICITDVAIQVSAVNSAARTSFWVLLPDMAFAFVFVIKYDLLLKI